VKLKNKSMNQKYNLIKIKKKNIMNNIVIKKSFPKKNNKQRH